MGLANSVSVRGWRIYVQRVTFSMVVVAMIISEIKKTTAVLQRNRIRLPRPCSSLVRITIFGQAITKSLSYLVTNAV